MHYGKLFVYVLKRLKNVNEKIKFVMDYLERNKNIYDKNRIENWLKTTRMAYKATPLNQLKFDKALIKNFANAI